MMKTIPILCVLLSLMMVSCTQEKSFEGTIDYIVTGTNQVTTLVEKNGEKVEQTEEKTQTFIEGTIFIKEKNAAIKAIIGKYKSVNLYLDPTTNEVVTSTTRLGGTTKTRKIQKNPIKARDQKLTASKTGNSKTINGYLCFEYSVRNLDSDFGTLWAAPSLQLDFAEIPLIEHSNEGPTEFLKPIKGIDGFVLAIETIEGKGTTNIELTVTEKKIEDSQFEIPEL